MPWALLVSYAWCLLHAEADSSYLNTGAKADLYSGTVLRAHHYFVGSTPTFEMVDTATGLSVGIVHGKPAAKAAVARQPDDGGFGSVADLLLTAFGGEGRGPCTERYHARYLPCFFPLMGSMLSPASAPVRPACMSTQGHEQAPCKLNVIGWGTPGRSGLPCPPSTGPLSGPCASQCAP